jgi:carbon-monoxide dehydrogenase medium subunit
MLEPDLVVDIKRIKGMREIRKSAGGFVIGAGTPNAALSENAALLKAWPGVVEAAQLIGSKQVQGRCTMVGNLCNASPAADAVPALVAAGAQAVVAGPRGKRRIAVEDVPAGVGRTVLKKGEIIEALALPAKKPRSGDAYLRFIPRTEMDIAVVSCGISLTIDGKGVITAARVALGAVAPTVLLVKEAAKAIIGSKLDDAAKARLAAAASAACRPIDDKRGTVEFRTDVAGVLARRAAEIAYARAGGK